MEALLLLAFLPLALAFSMGDDDDDNHDSSDDLAGDDTITGTDGTDSVTGLAGDNRIFLEGGDDQGEVTLAIEDDLDGAESFEDFLDIYENSGLFGAVGGTGDDYIDGGHGDDAIFGSQGDDTLWLEGGDDGNVLDESAADFIFSGNSIALSISLLEANDFFGGVGGNGNDYIDGGSGDDSLYGGAGDDTLRGNTGDDIIFDNLGSDTFNGGYGDDALVAWDNYQGSPDIVNGGAGDDILFIDDADQATGGAGWDSFFPLAKQGRWRGPSCDDHRLQSDPFRG